MFPAVMGTDRALGEFSQVCTVGTVFALAGTDENRGTDMERKSNIKNGQGEHYEKNHQ